METQTQTVEQFLFEQLEKIAPGKYTLANVIQMFKSRLRFPCSHLKGGGRRYSLTGLGKDYNLSVFRFPTGVTEIKCLYNCGLKIRSDEKELVYAFNELYDLPTTNNPASAEEVFTTKGGKRVPLDPGPVPTYTDEQRQRIKDSSEIFWKTIQHGLENGSIKPGDTVLGGFFPHPDPIEAPDTIVERNMLRAFVKSKLKNKDVIKATVVVQDSIPSVKPTKRVSKKTQSRRKRVGK